jgi:DNA-binding transcriptional MerR regulator
MSADTPKSIADILVAYDIAYEFITVCNREGLLTPGQPGERTVFFPRDEIRLRLILRSQRLGFSFAELKEILNATPFSLLL